MTTDLRGWRMALVPDVLVNPTAAARAVMPDLLAILESSGYGVLQLPPPGQHSLLLAVIADQVAEYAHHGYAVVAIGLAGEPGDGLHWRRLAPLLRKRNIDLPPRHIVRAAGDPEEQKQLLVRFLDGFDLPLEEQRRWRG
jgi:hypothetical protein